MTASFPTLGSLRPTYVKQVLGKALRTTSRDLFKQATLHILDGPFVPNLVPNLMQ